jgi:hypothetical protein
LQEFKAAHERPGGVVQGAEGLSDWAIERFGGAVEVLRRKIPAALDEAHKRALLAHQGLGLETNEAYGLIWRAQHEELVAHLRAVEGARVFKPKGARYQLVMIGNVIIYPWRYSDGSRVPLEDARMNLSEVRRNLLALGEADTSDQLTLDSAAVDDEVLAAEYEQAREDFRRLAASLRVVFVAYASNPRAGILDVEWGDATQADEDGHLKWTYHEPLPSPSLGESGGETGQRASLRAVPPGSSGASHARRFNDAPLHEPALTHRSPLTGVNSEQETPEQETGNDDR